MEIPNTHMKKYQYLKPREGNVIIKRVEEKTLLVKSGQTENKSYGRIIALPEGYDGDLSLNDLVAYDEYEGSEMFKYEKVKEDGLIILKDKHILCTIK